MARRAIAPLAPDVTLQPGYVVRVTALNPTTGALVAGVVVSDVRMQAYAQESAPPSKPVRLIPPVLTYPQT
jgi:hypothetical protein